MGCKIGRVKEEAVKSISFPIGITSPPVRNLDQVSEESIRECSLIPVSGENNKIKGSEEPSMFKMIQEL